MEEPIKLYKHTLDQKLKWATYNGMIKGFWNGFGLGVLFPVLVYLMLFFPE